MWSSLSVKDINKTPLNEAEAQRLDLCRKQINKGKRFGEPEADHLQLLMIRDYLYGRVDKMIKKIAAILFAILVPSLVSAQSLDPPYNTTMHLQWSIGQTQNGQVVGITPTEAQTFLYRYILDGAPAVTLSGVSCSALTPINPNLVNCSTLLTQSLVNTFNSSGTHTLTLQAFTSTGLGGPVSSPFSKTTSQPLPSAPSNLSVVP